jgi:hypothetical protein
MINKMSCNALISTQTSPKKIVSQLAAARDSLAFLPKYSWAPMVAYMGDAPEAGPEAKPGDDAFNAEAQLLVQVHQQVRLMAVIAYTRDIALFCRVCEQCVVPFSDICHDFWRARTGHLTIAIFRKWLFLGTIFPLDSALES